MYEKSHADLYLSQIQIIIQITDNCKDKLANRSMFPLYMSV